MFSSENHVGQLVEVRVATPLSLEELAELQQTHVALLAAIEGNYVVVADFRRAHVFPPKITERFIGLMLQLNPLLLRSGVLVSGSAVLGLHDFEGSAGGLEGMHSSPAKTADGVFLQVEPFDVRLVE